MNATILSDTVPMANVQIWMATIRANAMTNTMGLYVIRNMIHIVSCLYKYITEKVIKRRLTLSCYMLNQSHSRIGMSFAC